MLCEDAIIHNRGQEGSAQTLIDSGRTLGNSKPILRDGGQTLRLYEVPDKRKRRHDEAADGHHTIADRHHEVAADTTRLESDATK